MNNHAPDPVHKDLHIVIIVKLVNLLWSSSSSVSVDIICWNIISMLGGIRVVLFWLKAASFSWFRVNMISIGLMKRSIYKNSSEIVESDNRFKKRISNGIRWQRMYERSDLKRSIIRFWYKVLRKRLVTSGYLIIT